MKLVTVVGAFSPAIAMAGVGALLLKREQKTLSLKGSRPSGRRFHDFFDEVTKLVVGEGVPLKMNAGPTKTKGR